MCDPELSLCRFLGFGIWKDFFFHITQIFSETSESIEVVHFKVFALEKPLQIKQIVYHVKIRPLHWDLTEKTFLLEFFLDLWLVQKIELIHRFLILALYFGRFFSVFFRLLLLGDNFLLESNRLTDHEVSYLLVKVEIEHFLRFFSLK